MEVDRNAAVASSGTAASDPESPGSLFGDAAHAPSVDSDGDGNGTTFSTEDFPRPDADGWPEFEEPPVADRPFEDDGTTFSTHEGGGSPLEGADAEAPPSDDEGPGLLGQL